MSDTNQRRRALADMDTHEVKLVGQDGETRCYTYHVYDCAFPDGATRRVAWSDKDIQGQWDLRPGHNSDGGSDYYSNKLFWLKQERNAWVHVYDWTDAWGLPGEELVVYRSCHKILTPEQALYVLIWAKKAIPPELQPTLAAMHPCRQLMLLGGHAPSGLDQQSAEPCVVVESGTDQPGCSAPPPTALTQGDHRQVTNDPIGLHPCPVVLRGLNLPPLVIGRPVIDEDGSLRWWTTRRYKVVKALVDLYQEDPDCGVNRNEWTERANRVAPISVTVKDAVATARDLIKACPTFAGVIFFPRVANSGGYRLHNPHPTSPTTFPTSPT